MVYINTDNYSNRILLTKGQVEWIRDYDELLQEWIDDNDFENVDEWDIKKKIYKGSDAILQYFFFLYLRQKEYYTYEKKIQTIARKIYEDKGHIMLVLGQRRSGKTTFILSLLYEIKKLYNLKICWYGMPTQLPSFVDFQTFNMSKIPENSVTITDEASMYFSSRNSMKTKQKIEMQNIPVLGHSRKRMIIISQHEGLIDINWIRQASSILFTTKVIIPTRKERLIINEQLNYFMPLQKGEILYFDNDTIFEIKFKLPDWWQEKYSTPYKKFRNNGEKYITICKLLNDNIPKEEINTLLSYRNTSIDLSTLEFIWRLADKIGIENLLSKKEDELEKLVDNGFNDMPLNDIITGKKSFIKMEFTQREMYKIYWQKKFEDFPETEIISNINVNQSVFQDMKDISDNSNIIISIKGWTGTGKSLASLSIAECIASIFRKKPKAENICHNLHDIPEKIKNCTAGDVIILDEQEKEFGAGSGADEIKLRTYEETLRARQINFIFNSPRLHNHVHHFIIETFGINEKYQTSKCLIYTPDEKLIGYITIHRPQKEFEEKYLELKAKYNTIIQQDTTMAGKFEKQAAELIKDPDYQYAETIAEKRTFIRNKFNLSLSGTEEIMSIISMNEKKKKTLFG